MVDAIDRWTGRLSTALMFVAGIALMLMMIQMAVDVFMRNFFRSPIEGSLEIVSNYHMVAVVFLPLALVERRHEHITVDLFVNMMPAGAQRFVRIIGYLVCSVFFGLLTWQTGIDAFEAWQRDELLMSSIYIILWPAKMLLPIGFGLMLVQVLLHAWKSIASADFDPHAPLPTAHSGIRE
jgi:TRAP-type C4-dicarboxylate transport system permease small subunit